MLTQTDEILNEVLSLYRIHPVHVCGELTSSKYGKYIEPYQVAGFLPVLG